MDGLAAHQLGMVCGYLCVRHRVTRYRGVSRVAPISLIKGASTAAGLPSTAEQPHFSPQILSQPQSPAPRCPPNGGRTPPWTSRPARDRRKCPVRTIPQKPSQKWGLRDLARCQRRMTELGARSSSTKRVRSPRRVRNGVQGWANRRDGPAAGACCDDVAKTPKGAPKDAPQLTAVMAG